MLKMLNWNSVLYVGLLVFLRLQSISFRAKFYFEEVVEGIRSKVCFVSPFREINSDVEEAKRFPFYLFLGFWAKKAVGYIFWLNFVS